MNGKQPRPYRLKRWTAEDDEVLRAMAGEPLPYVAAAVGRTYASTQKRLERLGLVPDARRDWTRADLATLRKLARAGATVDAIAVTLGRTLHDVTQRRRDMKLPTPGLVNFFESCAAVIRRGNVYTDPEFSPIGPGTPTRAYPGSPEKIEVLRDRLAAGVELWHDADARPD